MASKWILLLPVVVLLTVSQVEGQTAPAPAPVVNTVNTTFTESDFVFTKCFPFGSTFANESGMLVAGIGEPYFNNGTACGSVINVQCVTDADHPWDNSTCIAGSVNVTIVDKCEDKPPCLNLHLNAFQIIATRNISGFIVSDFFEVSPGTGIDWTPPAQG
ncbi:hypothetical protein R1flu_004792 [Riccia fluitans]|uniref:Expansin-like EG45 domain-containing protein n=1 Tax=Riccia fluitans TaxID=41844 RepID=A0ABD1YRL7_9MARC